MIINIMQQKYKVMLQSKRKKNYMKVDEFKDNINKFLLDLQDDELSIQSINIYKHCLNQFLNYLEEKKLSTFNKSNLINYREFLISKYKISTTNMYIVIINKYLIYLKKDDLKVKQLKQQRKQSVENIPDSKDYKRMLRIAKNKNYLDVYYIMLIFGYSGIRVSELSYVTVESLKKSKSEKCILIFSKGKYKEIIIPKWLRRELLNYAKSIGITSGYIFHQKNNVKKPLHRSTIWRKIQKICGLARIDKRKGHPHALRHLFGKNYLKYVNNDYQQVADAMGHNSTKTSEIYTQLSREEKAEKIDKFKY